MSQQAVEKVDAVEIGTKDFERLGRLFRAADHNLNAYRMAPNYPGTQKLKSRLWHEYQDTLAELMEALNG